ncbi:MAG: universal stress protein [Deltaproteobacteria bacterium]|nr:universal stress protein [Deltaproteobacteria bacterium]
MIPEIKKILYATDLSDNARYAFGYAASLASRYGAGITVLHVVEDASPFRESMVVSVLGETKWKELLKSNEDKIVATLREGLETFCQDARDELPTCPFITDDIVVKIGNPVEKILKMISKTAADLVVMGAHGHGTLTDKLIGSTSRRVLRRCEKPVLLVRIPEKDDH